MIALPNSMPAEISLNSNFGDKIYFNKSEGNSYIDISQAQVQHDNNGPIISLFTGAGGMEIGLEKAGFKTGACVEIDADCRVTLKENRPEWGVFEKSDDRKAGDIKKISAEELLNFCNIEKGSASLVTGGAPCQPFSNIGSKKGKNDPKNGDLFLEFVKIVKGVRPKAFIFENVVGITQKRHTEVVDYMRHQFDGLGYGISFKVLNAADYGVPQKRKRFIMIGLLGRKPAFPLPTHYKDFTEWKKFTADLDSMPDYTPKAWKTVGNTLSKISKKTLKRHDCLGMNHSEEMIKRISYIGQGENFKVLPMEMRPPCWRSGKHQGHDTFGRIESDKPAPTIRTAGYNPTKGKYIHPFENRGLNTAEMAALQDFPETWVFHTLSGKPSIVSIGRQIGNAVPPGLSEAIGKALALQMDS